MVIKYRTQNDGLGDQMSAQSAMNFDGVEDAARQEFKDEVDTNRILQRYGAVPSGPLQSGEVDYTLDLQGALTLRRRMVDAFNSLDPELRKRYGSWENLLEAASTGELDPKSTDPSHPAGDLKPERATGGAAPLPKSEAKPETA